MKTSVGDSKSGEEMPSLATAKALPGPRKQKERGLGACIQILTAYQLEK